MDTVYDLHLAFCCEKVESYDENHPQNRREKIVRVLRVFLFASLLFKLIDLIIK